MADKFKYALIRPQKEDIKYSDLPIPNGLSSVGEGYSTGLYAPRVNPDIAADDVIKYLRTLDYRLDLQIDDINDCSERALFGITHARRRFPGCAIAMAEGLGQFGSPAEKRHAVIMIWEKGLKSYIFFDPLYPDQTNLKFGPVVRIVAFPFNFKETSDVELIAGNKMARINDNDYVKWDMVYNIYPMETKDGKGVLNYLNSELQETHCTNSGGHSSINEKYFGDYWKELDRAFWAYMHVRRDYPGCAIGVAYGDAVNGPSGLKNSMFVNIIWYIEQDGTYNIKYWDPRKDLRRVVNFTAKRIFF